MRITVGVVEDDNQTRKILGDWIRTAKDFELVGQWQDAETALQEIPALKPHVVLMDINLPGLSGVEAVKKLKLQMPQTQFVMLTVYQDTDHIYDALAGGATGYLVKQTPRQELLDALAEVHAGGSPMTSSIARKVVQSFNQPPAGVSPDEGLSQREQQVLELLARGYFFKEIAEQLDLSIPSVKTYIRRMYEKLHVRSRTQAVAKYARLT